MGRVVKAGPKPGTQVVRWQDEMAAAAKSVVEMEQNAGGGSFFGTKSGQLTFGGAPIPGNRMGVIILDHILENVYYGPERYDPENVQGPVCFALGRDEKTLAPHEVVIAKQNETCEGCPQNEWGSSDTGKGKACKNSRRLAVIAAGTFDKQGEFTPSDNIEHFKNAAVGYLKLPTTSVNGYATYVKQLAGVMKRPPFGVMTCIELVPDPKNQFKIVFTHIQDVDDAVMETAFARVQEARAAIDFPYTPRDPDAAPAKQARPASKAAFKGAAKYGAKR